MKHELFGLKLQKQRDAIKKSQGQIARVTGLSVSTISNYETGDRFPPEYNFKKIIKGYRFSEDDFLELVLDEYRQIAIYNIKN